ncbi:MAG: hypothetical protein SGILL_006390, partial [Bacillariaceae sp.]
EIDNDKPFTESRLKNSCDYVAIWVRDPIQRAIDAYSGYISTLKDTYQTVLESKVTNRKASLRRIQELALLQKRLQAFEKYGDLNGLAEQLYPNDDIIGITQQQAKSAPGIEQHIFGSIDHVKYSLAWYFWSDPRGEPLQAKSEAFDPPLTSSSWLTFPSFLSKLVFVGSNECYDQDVERFQNLFGVEESHRWKKPQSIYSSSSSNNNNNTPEANANAARMVEADGLSPIAVRNLRKFFKYFYKVLHTLSHYGLLHCQAQR